MRTGGPQGTPAARPPLRRSTGPSLLPSRLALLFRAFPRVRSRDFGRSDTPHRSAAEKILVPLPTPCYNLHTPPERSLDNLPNIATHRSGPPACRGAGVPAAQSVSNSLWTGAVLPVPIVDTGEAFMAFARSCSRFTPACANDQATSPTGGFVPACLRALALFGKVRMPPHDRPGADRPAACPTPRRETDA